MKKIRNWFIKYTTLIGIVLFNSGTTSMGMDVPTAYGVPAPSVSSVPKIILIVFGIIVIPAIIIYGIVAYNKIKTDENNQNNRGSNKHE